LNGPNYQFRIGFIRLTLYGYEKRPRRRRQRQVYDASVLGVGQAEKLTPSPFFLPIFPSIAK